MEGFEVQEANVCRLWTGFGDAMGPDESAKKSSEEEHILCMDVCLSYAVSGCVRLFFGSRVAGWLACLKALKLGVESVEDHSRNMLNHSIISM